MVNRWERILPERWRRALEGRGTIAAGAIVGALVGFTSVGSGALLVPFLMSVFPLSPARVVGTLERRTQDGACRGCWDY